MVLRATPFLIRCVCLIIYLFNGFANMGVLCPIVRSAVAEVVRDAAVTAAGFLKLPVTNTRSKILTE
jgi:hypothetical protein